MDNKMKKNSPLTEATFYILLSLVEPLHGYGIIKKVEKMSQGRIKLAAGTLYGALGSLLNYELIKALGENKENKRRKIYQMTALGRELIEYEIDRLTELVNNGKDELGV